MGVREYEISLRVFNSIAHEERRDIKLNTTSNSTSNSFAALTR